MGAQRLEESVPIAMLRWALSQGQGAAPAGHEPQKTPLLRGFFLWAPQRFVVEAPVAGSGGRACVRA